MNFRIVICPKCKSNQIVSYITCGVTCKCGLFINSKNTHDDARKEYAKDMKNFCFDFDHWRIEMEKWDAENKSVEFKTVSIPDNELLKIININ